MPLLRYKPLHEMKSETGPFLRKIAEVQKANAAPQERGRQKVIQDAKSHLRAEPCREKRTTERRTSAAPKGSGCTTADPFQILRGCKAGLLPPKIGGIPCKGRRSRTKKLEPFGTHSLSKASSQKAKSAAQRRMQRKILQKSAQSGGKTAKKLKRHRNASRKSDWEKASRLRSVQS